ncbi:hypothetical protein D3C81_887600 [compost metagenome]
MVLHVTAQALGNHLNLFGIATIDQDHELLSALTSNVIAWPERFPHDIGDLQQDRVTCQVAVPIVNLLEMVDVDEEQSERNFVALSGGDLMLHFHFERAGIV